MTQRITKMESKDKWGRTTVSAPCQTCGKPRMIIPSEAKKNLRCKTCANRERATRPFNGAPSTSHPLYSTLRGMIQRCGDPGSDSYARYGGRGIKVCPEWKRRGGFPAFAAWAEANGWAPGMTIDRIDSDGDYEPGNCQWVTLSQNSSTANSKRVQTPLGVFPSVAEAAKAHNSPAPTIYYRVQRGVDGYAYL